MFAQRWLVASECKWPMGADGSAGKMRARRQLLGRKEWSPVLSLKWRNEGLLWGPGQELGAWITALKPGAGSISRKEGSGASARRCLNEGHHREPHSQSSSLLQTLTHRSYCFLGCSGNLFWVYFWDLIKIWWMLLPDAMWWKSLMKTLWSVLIPRFTRSGVRRPLSML